MFFLNQVAALLSKRLFRYPSKLSGSVFSQSICFAAIVLITHECPSTLLRNTGISGKILSSSFAVGNLFSFILFSSNLKAKILPLTGFISANIANTSFNDFTFSRFALEIYNPPSKECV